MVKKKKQTLPGRWGTSKLFTGVHASINKVIFSVTMLLFHVSGSTFNNFLILILKWPEKAEEMPCVSSHRGSSRARIKEILFNRTKRTHCIRFLPNMANLFNNESITLLLFSVHQLKEMTQTITMTFFVPPSFEMFTKLRWAWLADKQYRVWLIFAVGQVLPTFPSSTTAQCVAGWLAQS